MGSSESSNQQLLSKNYQIIEKDLRLGIYKVNQKQTDQFFLYREINVSSQKQIMNMERLIDIKLSLQSPYLSKLEKAITKTSKQYCTSSRIFYLLFKYPLQTLKQESLNRKFKKQMFSQEQLQLILEVGVKALLFLKNINQPHRNVSSSSIFITQGRNIIVGDPWMFSNQKDPKNSYISTKNVVIYPSPEVLKFQKQEIDEYDFYLSDLFTFGMVLLQIFFMNNMDILYQKNFDRVNYDAINKKINTLSNQALRKKLFIILDYQPKNRNLIYKYYQKKPQSQEYFTQKVKQKFKKNIEKYNLATSQVTEWKTTQRVTSSDKLTSFLGQNRYSSNQQKPVSFQRNMDKNQQIINNFSNFQKQKSQLEIKRPHSQNYYFKGNFEVLNINKPYSSNTFQTSPYNTNGYIQNYSKNLIQPLQQNSYKSILPLNVPFQKNSENPFLNTSQNLYIKKQMNPIFQTKNEKKPYQQLYKSNNFEQNNYSNYNFNKPIIKQSLSQNFPKISLKNMKPTHQSFQSKQSQESLQQNSKFSYDFQKNNNKNLIFQQQIPQNEVSQKLQSQCDSRNKIFNSSAIQQKDDDIITMKKSNSIASQKTPTRFRIQPQIHFLSTINQRSEKTDSMKSQKQSIKIYTITYQSGTRYEGQMLQDKRNGRGIFYYVDGSRYDGQWKDNKMHGKGTLYYPNNSIAYQGDWLYDNFHGFGQVFNDEPLQLNSMYHYQKAFDVDDYWKSYQGQLYEDQRQGNGLLKLVNGQYFQGQFKNDKLNGFCKFYRLNGQIIQGEWKDNLMIQKK